MKLSHILILVLALALVATPAFAREGKYRNSGAIGVWNTELFGEATIDTVKFNLKGNGNFGKENNVHFGWTWKTGKLSDVQIVFTQIKNAGTINKNITINNIAYNAGATVNLELSTFDILGHRELSKGEQGWLDFVYGIKMINFDVNATGRDALNVARTSSESFNVPLPQFGLAGEYYINPRWTAYGSFYGFSINRDNKGGTVKTFDGGFQYRFNPKHDVATDKVDWYAQLGWKAQYLRAKDRNDEVIIDHEGPRLVFVGKF